MARRFEGAGKLVLAMRGNVAFLLLQGRHPYTTIFADGKRRVSREIGLSLAGQWEALRKLAGQTVLVTGKVQLEPSSPYYWNGILIIASAIRTRDGVTLYPNPSRPAVVPATVTGYRTRVTFTPRAAERWSYLTWDAEGKQLAGAAGYLACSLNGPGDVMNCYCADGFVAAAFGSMRRGVFLRRGAPPTDFDFAQFPLDDPIRGSFRMAVECVRQPAP